MAYNPLFDLTEQLVSQSFKNILQIDDNGVLYNGVGEEIPQLTTPSSGAVLLAETYNPGTSTGILICSQYNPNL